MHGPDRRGFLIGAAAAAAALPFAPAEAAIADVILRRAIRRAGGYELLSRVRLLSWEGDAVVHSGGRDIALGMSTMVSPFSSARSTSWPAAAGRSAARTMIISETGGWIEREGRNEPLPPRQVVHERAQFAIYGLMLLAPLDHGGALLRVRRVPHKGIRILRVSHRRAPLTHFHIEDSGRLAEAYNHVPHPETGKPIRQRFIFSREEMPGPVRWPRRISIEQEGQPYFELDLKRFEAVA